MLSNNLFLKQLRSFRKLYSFRRGGHRHERRIRDTLWLKPRNGGGFYNFFEKLKKNTANLSDDHFFCIYSYWKYLPTFLKLYIKLKLKYDLKLKLDFKLTYDFKLKLLATFFSI